VQLPLLKRNMGHIYGIYLKVRGKVHSYPKCMFNVY